MVKLKKKVNVKRGVFIVGMLSIAIANFLVFWLYVNFSSIMMAFTLPLDEAFTLENFARFFREVGRGGGVILQALKNTLIFFASTMCVLLPLSVIFSYFLFKKVAGYKFYRVVFFLPSIISSVVLATMYSQMFSLNGPVNLLLEKLFGMDPVRFLRDSRYALWTLVLYNVWSGFGSSLILFNGAMARIPEDILEYGKLDGVGFFREMFRVVVPLVWPTISTVIVLNTVGLFGAGAPILLFTEGKFDTYTISYWIYEQVATLDGAKNYAAAVGIVFTLIGVPIVLVVKFLMGKVMEDVEF